MLELEVNGVMKQDSNSGKMIFNIVEQIADLSAKTGKPTNARYAEARKLLYAAR